MNSNNLTRRQILGGTAAALGGLAATNFATAGKAEQYNVGVESPAAKRATEKAAKEVKKVFDWDGDEVAITGTFSEKALSKLQDRPDVRYVERDGVIKAHDQSVPWGIDRVDAEVAYGNGDTGGDDTDGDGGAHVAIIDSGVDSDHPDLAPNLGKGYAATPCDKTEGDCNEPWDDDLYHGTHVAGTAGAVDDDSGVVGVAPDVTLHAVKVLDYRGFGLFSDVAEGIRWVADQGYDVANMSLGGGKTKVVEDAVKYAYDKGVLLVGSAGNLGCLDCVGYPAAEPEVIAVGATNDDDETAWFSSRGAQVNIAAPGVDVNSAIPGGDYYELSGTSMSSPHVAGAGAQLMDNGHDNESAREALEESAEDIGLESEATGNGLLDVAAALGYDSSDSVGDPSGPESIDPTVESLSVSEVDQSSSPRFAVEWSVADGGANLETVTVGLYEIGATGLQKSVEDTAKVAVSGNSDSGTTELAATESSEYGFEVEIVVEDAADNLGAATTGVGTSD